MNRHIFYRSDSNLRNIKFLQRARPSQYLIINQYRNILIVYIARIVPNSARIDVLHRFAIRCGNAHFNGFVADQIRILRHGTEEPTLSDSILLSGARIKSGDEQVLVLSALRQIFAIRDSGQEARHRAFVHAEDRSRPKVQQSVRSRLKRSGLSGGADFNSNDDGGILHGICINVMSFDGNFACLICFCNLRHRLDKAARALDL